MLPPPKTNSRHADTKSQLEKFRATLVPNDDCARLPDVWQINLQAMRSLQANVLLQCGLLPVALAHPQNNMRPNAKPPAQTQESLMSLCLYRLVSVSKIVNGGVSLVLGKIVNGVV